MYHCVSFSVIFLWSVRSHSELLTHWKQLGQVPLTPSPLAHIASHLPSWCLPWFETLTWGCLVFYSSWGWRDGSLVKSTGCSSTDPWFNSWHLHGDSWLPVVPVLGDSMGCRLLGHWQMWHTAAKTPKYIFKKCSTCKLTHYNIRNVCKHWYWHACQKDINSTLPFATYVKRVCVHCKTWPSSLVLFLKWPWYEIWTIILLKG